MKKSFLALALLVSAAGTAQAQGFLKNTVNNLSFGVKGGGGAATFTGDGAKNLTAIPSFSGGAFVALKVTEHFSVQEDFLYTRKGAKMDNFLVAGNQLQSTLGYADVHFMLRYAFGQGGNGFFIEAGPTGSFLINQDTKVNNNAGKEILASTGKDDFTKIVAGYAGGIGYKTANGLQISARYNGDLMPVYKEDLGYPKLLNATAQVQIGYTFGKRK